MTSVRRHLLALGCAIQFLTQIPLRLPGIPDPRLQSMAMLYYPLVGLLIGVLLCLLAWMAQGLPIELQATLILLLWCGVTGGLHLDGLADSADGWMGGLGDRERTLAIMKDPHIGAMGVIALLLQLLLKWSLLLALLPTANLWLPLLIAPVVGRTLSLLLLASTPYAHDQGARERGIASEMLPGLSRPAVYGIAGLMGLLLLVLHPFWLLLPLLLFWGGRSAMLHRLRGATGDTAGALIELGESLLLLAAALTYC